MGERASGNIDPALTRTINRNLKLFREQTVSFPENRERERPFSQEYVAGVVGCATRTIAAIEAAAGDEADLYSPPIVIVARMIAVYRKTLNDLLIAPAKRR